MSVFLAALIVRVTVALVLSATTGMDPFSDTKLFDRLASDLANGAYQHWGERDAFFYDLLGGYVLPLGVLYRLFGSHLILGQLFAALFGAIAAAAICKLTLLVTNRRAALVAGSIVAVFPSQVLWSSVAYRDSEVWAATSVAALLVAMGVRARGWRLASIGVGLTALVFVLGHLRLVTMMAVAGALVVAALLSSPQGRAVRLAGALAIAVLMPLQLGYGPAGVKLIKPLGDTRAARACGAASAFTDCRSDTNSSIFSDLGHLPRGLSVMLLEPAPWASATSLELRLAQAELLVWLPLLGVAACGLPEAYRRRRELAFLVLTAGAVLITYALGEGNVGTAYRHRSELVPALAVLAALGAPRLVKWWQERRTTHDPRELRESAPLAQDLPPASGR